MALRNVEPWVGEVARGEDVRRRMVDGSTGEEGEVVLLEDDERTNFGFDIAPALTDRDILFDVIRDLDDEEEMGERSGDDGRVEVELCDKDGEAARLMGGDAALTACEVEVAWCLKLGGDVAIALAFARLAAIAAATLLFLLFFGVAGDKTVATVSRSGQDFSSCFRATASKDSRKTLPRSRHTFSKAQKHERALSLTPILASVKAFFTAFSKISKPPEVSIACFE
jgi:hypothetical protein